MEGFFVIQIFSVYILYSHSLQKFYAGFNSDIVQHLEFHNSGKNSFSKKGVPWKIIKTIETQDKSSALLLEKQIKKNGAKRYLERNNIEYII